MRVTNIYNNKQSHEFRITPEGAIFKNGFNQDEELLVELDSDGDLTGLFLWSEFLQDWMELDYDKINKEKKQQIQKLVDEYKEENEIGSNFIDDEF